MKILIDIGHPKNAHIMRNLAPVLRVRGHVLHLVYRERERLGELCNAFGLEGESRGRGGEGRLGKFLYLIRADCRMLRLAGKLKPDLLLSFGSPYLAHVAGVSGIPMVVFDDTEDNPWIQRIYARSASVVVVPSCFRKELSPSHRRFDGYFELAYLHPDSFTSQASIRQELRLAAGEKLVLVRTVAWQALHDWKHRGLTGDELNRLVEEFTGSARVVISAEGELPEDLEPLRLKTAPERIHHVMAEASLVFSEGATMAAEGAVLGVPTIHISDLRPGYIIDLENRHGLLRSFVHGDFHDALVAGGEFLQGGETLRKNLAQRRERMLKESVDVIRFMADCVDRFATKRDILR